MSSLVVYYSRSGKTKVVAEKIAEVLNADNEEIVDLKDRKGWIGFLKSGFDATIGRETRIEEMKKSVSDYDLVVMGTPIWNSRPTPAIRTFISQNDFSERNVAIFCTCEGMGQDKIIRRIKALIPKCKIVGELVLTKVLKDEQETEKKIMEWCKTLEIN